MELSTCSTNSAPLFHLKWPIIIVGVLTLSFVIGIFLSYRYIKAINARFAKLEEILGKVIEKNNQIQHVLQSAATVSQPPPAVIFAHPPTPPPPPPSSPQSQSPPPVMAVPPVNLDKEIENELKELAEKTEEKEGRVEDPNAESSS